MRRAHPPALDLSADQAHAAESRDHRELEAADDFAVDLRDYQLVPTLRGDRVVRVPVRLRQRVARLLALCAEDVVGEQANDRRYVLATSAADANGRRRCVGHWRF